MYLPDFDLGEGCAQRRDHRRNSPLVDIVGLYPLQKNAVRLETGCGSVIELLSEEARHPRPIRIGWLGKHQIVLDRISPVRP